MRWEVRTMRSGTSLFNGTIFKKTVLRYWPVWGAYSVIWLLVLPLQGLMMLQLEAQARPGLTGGYMQTFAQQVGDLIQLSLALAVFFGALCAMAVCSHLYNPRSANFFGSLPVKREGLFLTHYLAGLAFLLVPNLAVFLLTLLIEAIGGAVFLPGLGFWLAVTCGECLFFYTMAVFCGMFTGHILALPAFYGIFNVLAYGVYFLVETVFRKFYYGFTGFSSASSGVVAWLTPIVRLGRRTARDLWVTEDGCRIFGLENVAVYVAAAVVLAAGSFFLYRARRLESAGDVVSVKCMRPVFQYGVAFCAGLALGIFTTAFLNGEEPTLMVSILVWAAIGWFVARMLLEKSFRVFRHWKGAAVTAGVFALLFLVVGLDLTGFESRVPTADQVESVELEGFRMCHLGDGGDNFTVEADSPELVDYAILLHQAAVDQRDGGPAGDTVSTTLRVTYHLKNGGELARWYVNFWVDPNEADREGTSAWAIQQMYDDRELYWKGYGFAEAERLLSEEGWRLQEATYENDGHDEGVDQTLYYGGADARALYEAVKEDFQAGRIGVRRVEDWQNSRYTQNHLRFSFAAVDQPGMGIYIRVQDTASSTLAVLERLEQEQAWTASSDTPPLQTEYVGPQGEARPAPTDVPATVVDAVPTQEPAPTAEPVTG
ncbi:MAG: hypothetical protein HFF20_07065 [Oscillospiraceae bacterium]|nr:hypothetical protein [Oscillospiraceae bacterium]MCI9309351.1 hypothetical protein [Oscillospiraceae bacterium]MCI9548968.1 hypothetical protein [Oscillospiraceae bacterium]